MAASFHVDLNHQLNGVWPRERGGSWFLGRKSCRHFTKALGMTNLNREPWVAADGNKLTNSLLFVMKKTLVKAKYLPLLTPKSYYNYL